MKLLLIHFFPRFLVPSPWGPSPHRLLLFPLGAGRQAEIRAFPAVNRGQLGRRGGRRNRRRVWLKPADGSRRRPFLTDATEMALFLRPEPPWAARCFCGNRLDRKRERVRACMYTCMRVCVCARVHSSLVAQLQKMETFCLWLRSLFKKRFHVPNSPAHSLQVQQGPARGPSAAGCSQ